MRGSAAAAAISGPNPNHIPSSGSLHSCSSDKSTLQFPLAQRRKRRVLFTQAQVWCQFGFGYWNNCSRVLHDWKWMAKHVWIQHLQCSMPMLTCLELLKFLLCLLKRHNIGTYQGVDFRFTILGLNSRLLQALVFSISKFVKCTLSRGALLFFFGSVSNHEAISRNNFFTRNLSESE